MFLFRLSKYSRFTISHKLSGFLGEVEDKVALATSGGSDRGVTQKLSTIVPHSTTGKTFLTRRVLPQTEILPNMTGEAMWRRFVNTSEDKEPKDSGPSPITQVRDYNIGSRITVLIL